MTTKQKYSRLKHQLEVLNELMPKYGGRTLENIAQNIKSSIKWIEEENLGIKEQEEDDNITLDIETQARLVNGHWEDFVKEKKLKFSCDDAEGQCKALFVAGYWWAWEDLSELSSRAMALDEILSSQV